MFSATPGGTRTLSLTLRRGAPYPLGHRGKEMLPEGIEPSTLGS